jgi:putative ABC transport system ATP-binding protein
MPSGDPLRVLDDVSLDIPAGSCVSLMGSSGSGKSSLLHILGGVDDANSGRCQVDGVNLTGLRRKAQADFRARHVGFIFQFFNLLPTLTARENVETGLEPLNAGRKLRARLSLSALGAVGLDGQEDKFPAQLSGGQQQRVAIARAIAKMPPVLLADEPTGALDARTAETVMSTLMQIHRAVGSTLIIATHDPQVAGYTDLCYEVGGGKLKVHQ